MIPASNNLLLASADEGYNLTRSLRFRYSASAYLNRTPASAGNRKTFTWSAWVKRGALGINGTLFSNGNGTNANGYFSFRFNTDNTVSIFNDNDGTLTTCDWSFTNVFRDVAAWYHLILAIDTTQATQNNRLKLYVNGVENTNRSVTTYPSQNSDLNINRTVPHQIGQFGFGSNQYFDGYLTEVNFIDGSQLTPSSFGETDLTTGVWKPKRYAGTYGTNGFYLPFTDNSALTTSSNAGLGKDFSGNGNYWTTNNISITSGVTYDSMTDVPTLTSATAANFAVLNRNVNRLYGGTGFGTYTDGNLKATWTSGGETFQAFGSIEITPSTPKVYWEVRNLVIGDSGNYPIVGIANANQTTTSTNTTWFITAGGGVGVYANGAVYANASLTSVTAPSTTSTIGFAYDPATGKFWIAIAGVWQNSGNPETGANPATTLATTNNWLPVLGEYGGSGSSSAINFGQQPFAYTPPTGYVALNTYNLPTPTIVKGNTVMDATTYSGSGSSQSVVNDGAFKPDFIWIKARNNTSGVGHMVADSVRGGTNVLHSDSTSAEQNNLYGAISSFNSNGFTTASGSTNSAEVHQSGFNYVGWQWQAGQGSTSSNTNGTITSTVSVNASAGFSVVTYTGTGANATVGHGLGVAPSLIIVKRRNSTSNWNVYHASVGATGVLLLNLTDTTATTSVAWNNTAPTSSVFTVGTGNDVNASGGTFVAYCFASIAGFSSFSNYTGNGSTDGVFVYTGFRPKFVMIKRTNVADDWYINDTIRDPSNVTGLTLLADSSNAEANYSPTIDILSNGFKVRQSGAGYNASGGNYVYTCWAETPFKNALAR